MKINSVKQKSDRFVDHQENGENPFHQNKQTSPDNNKTNLKRRVNTENFNMVIQK